MSLAKQLPRLLRPCPQCGLLSRMTKTPPATLSTSRVLAFSTSKVLAISRSKPHSLPASTPPSTSSSQTYYKLFPKTLYHGPPPRGPFSIDTRALHDEFRSLQAKNHPDTQPPNKRAIAEVKSSQLNDAFRTLADPLHRAQYLLSLKGVDLAGDEAARVDDTELLMTVMDAREAIEDAVEEEDLEPTRVENQARIDASVGALDEAFSVDDVERAKREAVRLRYWVNIADALLNWEKGRPSVLMH